MHELTSVCYLYHLKHIQCNIQGINLFDSSFWTGMCLVENIRNLFQFKVDGYLLTWIDIFSVKNFNIVSTKGNCKKANLPILPGFKSKPNSWCIQVLTESDKDLNSDWTRFPNAFIKFTFYLIDVGCWISQQKWLTKWPDCFLSAASHDSNLKVTHDTFLLRAWQRIDNWGNLEWFGKKDKKRHYFYDSTKFSFNFYQN